MFLWNPQRHTGTQKRDLNGNNTYKLEINSNLNANPMGMCPSTEALWEIVILNHYNMEHGLACLLCARNDGEDHFNYRLWRVRKTHANKRKHGICWRLTLLSCGSCTGHWWRHAGCGVGSLAVPGTTGRGPGGRCCCCCCCAPPSRERLSPPSTVAAARLESCLRQTNWIIKSING